MMVVNAILPVDTTSCYLFVPLCILASCRLVPGQPFHQQRHGHTQEGLIEDKFNCEFECHFCISIHSSCTNAIAVHFYYEIHTLTHKWNCPLSRLFHWSFNWLNFVHIIANVLTPMALSMACTFFPSSLSLSLPLSLFFHCLSWPLWEHLASLETKQSQASNLCTRQRCFYTSSSFSAQAVSFHLEMEKICFHCPDSASGCESHPCHLLLLLLMFFSFFLLFSSALANEKSRIHSSVCQKSTRFVSVCNLLPMNEQPFNSVLAFDP